MELTFEERLLMNLLYPRRSDLQTQIIVRDIRKRVEASQEDLKKVDWVSNPDGTSRYNKEKAKKLAVKVEFSEAELSFLKDQVDRLDKEEAVVPDIVDLLLKIKEA